MFKIILFANLIFPFFALADANEKSLTVELTIPKLEAHPYHKPFVAVWLETEQRQPLETIAIWYDDAEWLKDLRQWWRKLGRRQHADGVLDGLSGATRNPGTYSITWRGHSTEKRIYVNIEVVREEGGRSYHRELIDTTKVDIYSITATHEYGPSSIRVGKSY